MVGNGKKSGIEKLQELVVSLRCSLLLELEADRYCLCAQGQATRLIRRRVGRYYAIRMEVSFLFSPS